MRMKAFQAAAVALLLATTGCAHLGGMRDGESAKPQLAAPTAVEFKLANGMKVLVVRRPQLPIVTVEVILRAGAVTEPEGKGGLAGITADLLKRGTASRTAPQIAEAIDGVGGSLSTGAGVDTAHASLSVLTKDLDLGLDLLSDVLARPAFAQAEFARAKEETLAGLKSSLDDANDVVKMATRQVVLAGNPYGRVATLGSVGALTLPDVQAFYQAHYGPNNATVAIVGDVDPQLVVLKLQQAFAAWAAATAAASPVSALAPLAGRQVYLVDMDVNQSFVMLGHPAVKRDNPDFFPLQVLNFILGGDFTSRLNLEIRDRQGLAYGAGSQFQMFRDTGFFSASLNTRTATTAQALQSLFAQLHAIQDKAVTSAELDTAKAYLTGSFPLRFETDAELANELLNIESYGLKPDYLATYRAKVLAVTASDVQRVAKAYLKPNDYDLVVVGRASELNGALAPFGTVKLLPKEQLIR